MKRFATGWLGWRPEEFGITRVGDIIDALIGYHETRNEQNRYQTEIIRRATTLLWNIHLMDPGAAKNEYELWPLAWDKDTRVAVEYSDEEYERVIREQREYLMRN